MLNPATLTRPGPWHVPEIALAALFGLTYALWFGWL
jgi:hypothetical protein